MTLTASLSQHPLPPEVPLPLVTKLLKLRNFHTGGELIRELCGPVALASFLSLRDFQFAFVSSPQGAHDVLAAPRGVVDKDLLTIRESRIWGDNLFNMRMSEWLPRRRVLQPLFTKHQVAQYAGHMAAAADDAARGWVGQGEVDLDRECRRIALRVIGRSVFGIDLGTRADGLERDVHRTLRWATHRSVRPVRAPMWLPTIARSRYRRAMSRVQRILDEAIQAFRDDPSRDAALVRQLHEARDPVTGQRLSDQAIRDELYVFLVAGHDTTATTLTYALWELGRNRDLQERVAREIAALGDRRLTAADVAHLPLTIRVLHEAMRLCPPGAAIGRLALEDLVVDGFHIPAGTTLVVSVYALHRDPQLWPDPTRFDPGRFAPENAAGRDRWQFIPFGGGQRSCIGDHFAMLEATLALASLVRAAEVTSLSDSFPTALPFTLTAKGPIPARVRARNRTEETR